MKALHIFRPGAHTDSSGTQITFAEADVQQMAAAYDPAVHEAPIVVGHPATDDPAYGWVAGLEYADGALMATPQQIDPQFAELVQAGRYKHVSASFYTPDSPSNPVPGGYYLRHVGFLGAQPPAVKGLRPIEFGETAEGVISVEFHDPAGQYTIAALWRSMRDWLLSTSGQETADQVVPGYLVEDLEAGARRAAEVSQQAAIDAAYSEPEVDAMTQEELERREAELKAGQDKLAADQTAFAERVASVEAREAELREIETRSFLDGLVREGRVLPAEVDQQVAFMSSLDDSEETVEFSEGQRRTPLAAYRETLKARRKMVTFGERSAGTGDDARELDNADAIDVGHRARQYREQQAAAGVTISTRDAVRAVTSGQAQA